MAAIESGPGWRSSGVVKPDPDVDQVRPGRHDAAGRIWAQVATAPDRDAIDPGDFLRFHTQLCQVLFRAPVDPAQARRLGLHDLLAVAGGRYDQPVSRDGFLRFLASLAASWPGADLLAVVDAGLRASTPLSIEGAQPIDRFRHCQSLAEAGQYGEESSRRGSLEPARNTSGWARLRAWFRIKMRAVPRILTRWPGRTPKTASTITEPATSRPVTLLVAAQPTSEELSEEEPRLRAQSLPELFEHRRPMMPPRSASVAIDEAVDVAQRAETQLSAIVAGRKRIEALIGRMQSSSDIDSDERDLNPNFNDHDEFISESELSSSWSMVQRRERHRRLLLRMKARSGKAVQWPRDRPPDTKSHWSESD